MFRRRVCSAAVLAASVLVAVWLLTGCGQAPTAPSDEDRLRAGADAGDWTLTASSPDTSGPRGVRITTWTGERRVDSFRATPDVGRPGSGHVAEAVDAGPPEARSRYALASARM